MSRRSTQIVAAITLSALPATAWAWSFHNHLVKSAPLTGETVASPKAITLWFSEKPELKLSTIALAGADSATIATGKVTEAAGDTNAVTATVDKKLAAGEYTVKWQTAGSDGHPSRGKYTFTVK